MFNDLVESVPAQTHMRKPWTLAVSAALQSICLGVLVLIPLLYTEALPRPPLPQFVVVPLASGATLRSTAHTAPQNAHRPGFLRDGVFLAPVSYPRHAAVIQEVAAPDADPGPIGELLPGLGIASSFVIAPAPLIPQAGSPAAQPPARRIPVGGVIENAKLIFRVQPVYPSLAVIAGIEGAVLLHAVIAKDGSIGELQVVSGHPLLIKAAVDAVRQWRYQPTLLNGDPVEVETTISVSFVLGR